MLTYRTFRNTDPPVLTELWRSRSAGLGLVEPVSPDLFEQLVFAKLYFDYDGLFLAEDDGRPVGFAHAGFGPDDEQERLSTALGVTCLVLVRSDSAQFEVAAGLLERCEAYLRRRGAKVLYGGGIRPLNPFYLGMYGGSELPGVLESDTLVCELYRARAYRQIDRTLILRRDLDGFEVIVDRDQMQIRRRMIVEVTNDAPTQTWWEACTLGEFDVTRFELVPRMGGNAAARASFRSMEASGVTMLGRVAGLIELEVDDSMRRRGLAVFLLCEAFRQFLRQGISVVEAQCMEHNVPARRLYEKLGFQQCGSGAVFRKQ